jgi:hypothetical protein
MEAYVPDRVHLVGSIGLHIVDELLRTVGSMLGRIPDGDPGSRRMWASLKYRDDFFAPMRDFALSPKTEIYLGLLHAADGIEGSIALAHNYVPELALRLNAASAARASRISYLAFSRSMQEPRASLHGNKRRLRRVAADLSDKTDGGQLCETDGGLSLLRRRRWSLGKVRSTFSLLAYSSNRSRKNSDSAAARSRPRSLLRTL